MIGVTPHEVSALNYSNVAPWKLLEDGSIAAVIGVHYQMNCLVRRTLTTATLMTSN
jgi:hypothetical protein